ncbi:ribonuclease H-like domain-containing protein [Tanacetum coccineum]
MPEQARTQRVFRYNSKRRLSQEDVESLSYKVVQLWIRRLTLLKEKLHVLSKSSEEMAFPRTIEERLILLMGKAADLEIRMHGDNKDIAGSSGIMGYHRRRDFDETFSLVVKIVTVRCLINLAVQNGWTLYQMDVNNAFLYGD